MKIATLSVAAALAAGSLFCVDAGAQTARKYVVTGLGSLDGSVGNTVANKQAVNQLNAFIGAVQTQWKNGKLSSATAHALIDAANAIIATLT